MIPIKKKVKQPEGTRGRVEKYPFSKMVIGDMFEQPIENYGNVARAAHQYGKRKGVKMTIRKINEKTCGIWRVS